MRKETPIHTFPKLLKDIIIHPKKTCKKILNNFN
jgi:hypothetical protein